MAINSSRLKITVRESITLNDNKYDSFITHNIDGINEISKRIITVAGDNQLHNIIQVSGSIGPGAFLTDDVKYMRFTNLNDADTGGVLDLVFKNHVNDEYSVKLDHGQTYMYPGLTTGGVSESMAAIDNGELTLTNAASLSRVIATTSGSAIDLEIFIAST